MHIRSVHNPRVRAVSALRDHQVRLQQRRTLVDGVREIQRALARAPIVRELYWLAEECRSWEHQRVLAEAERQGVKLFEVSRAVFERLCYGQRSEGMLAVAATPSTRLADFPVPGPPLILVLEAVEKPGNIGAVARTADAVQAGLLLADSKTDVFNPNAIRASLGTVFHIPIAEDSADAVRCWLLQNNYQIIATTVDAPRLYWETPMNQRTAIVLGSETCGLSGLWKEPNVLQVRLPMRGTGDSLNVSTTAAVLAYEWLRCHESCRRH